MHTSDWAPVRALKNGGFEVGEPALPLGWWRGGLGYDHFSFGWLGVESWEGARAVNISRHDASDEDFGFWAQTIFAEGFRGGPATLRVQIKSDLVGQGVSVVIRGDDSLRPLGNAEAFATTQGRIPITGSQDWTEYSVTMSEVPFAMESLTVYLVFLPGTTGTVSFDGVTLTP